MKPNVILKALVRLAASLTAAGLMFAPAMAAERALINFLGYDLHSQYFAFEEYGMIDGVGGYYDHIYVIDLGNDSWVKNSPIIVEETADNADPQLADVRKKALDKARPILDALKIQSPTEIEALYGDGINSGRNQISWSTPNCCGVDTTEDSKFTLSLTTMPIPKENLTDACADYGGNAPDQWETLGFALTYEDSTGKHVIHDDGGKIPNSRGCTFGYSIYAVVDNAEMGGGELAIIETWPQGFEGPDRRFLVVPIHG